jgi:hypothetical protein
VVRFYIDRNQPRLEGQLLFVEHSLEFVPDLPRELAAREGSWGVTSVVIDTVQIEIGIEQGNVLYVWGFLGPVEFLNRRQITLAPPLSHPVGLRVADDAGEFIPGVSIGLDWDRAWPVGYDPRSGWICIGKPNVMATNDCIEFASNSIAVIEKGELQALWLRPAMT